MHSKNTILGRFAPKNAKGLTIAEPALDALAIDPARRLREARNMEPFIYTPPAPGPLPVLFEDAALIALNKPEGLLSVPGRRVEHQDSLYTRIRALHPEAMVVHRLDLATSGVIVMAKTREANRALSWQFQRRTVEKTYEAVVEGVPAEASGCVDLPLICDWPDRPRQIVDPVQGKPSQTEWVALGAQDVSGRAGTRVRLRPLTGRSHQLRVHMAEMGHAIFGDRFYASEDGAAASKRLLLHAHVLTLTHPDDSARTLRFEAPCPF